MVTVGSARIPERLELAEEIRTLSAATADVTELVTWPSQAASWLRPAQRLARSQATIIVLVSEQDWTGGILHRLAAQQLADVVVLTVASGQLYRLSVPEHI